VQPAEESVKVRRKRAVVEFGAKPMKARSS
jgi:hypothetical protein